MNRRSIIVTGHPYAFPYYFKVFEYLENKDSYAFILPKVWKAKNGKINIKLNKRSGFHIYGVKAVSFGGRAVAGLFKGWMPAMAVLLPYMRLKYGSKVLYGCSEPNLLTSFYNGFFAKLFGYKHILFTWQNVAPEQRMRGLKLKLSNALVRLNLWFADGIICGNKKAADIIGKFKVKSSKFKVLICPLSGVDAERFKPGIKSNWREKLNIKPEEKIIVFYGALDKRKGLSVLIEAFRILNYKLPTINYKLVIVGTGPLKENIKSQISNFKLEDRVILLDWMKNEELPALLNAADVFVYPSVPSGGWEEQFGYAMAEASACAIPVVATKTGSIDEVVVDGKSGILVEPNNPEQLAEAMAKLAADEDLRKKMGQAGREFIVKNYSNKIVAEKFYHFFQSIDLR